MNAKKSILFVFQSQIGYGSNYCDYIRYLVDFGYRVGVVCLDCGKKKVSFDSEVEILYLKNKNLIQYRLALIWNAIKLHKKYDFVVLNQMSGLWLGSLSIPYKKRFLYLRTGSVANNRLKRFLENTDMRLQILSFRKILVLSSLLADKFRIPKNKRVIFPLGAEELAKNEKTYSDKLRLLYVGTFNNRRIEETIEGLSLFLNHNSALKSLITYDIVGGGSPVEESKLKQSIKNLNLQDIVHLHGYLTHDEAGSLYEACNVGVCHVPIDERYDVQPPTKIYEYALSGLVSLATETKANKELISNDNGILYSDTSQGFCDALQTYWRRRFEYQTAVIKSTLSLYRKKDIVEKNLIPNLC